MEVTASETSIKVEERPTKFRRLLQTAQDIATFTVSSFVRLGIEAAVYKQTGMSGLIAVKVGQLLYDRSQGNQRMFEGNIRQLVEAFSLYQGTPQVYAAVKAAELGLDIYRKDWITAWETLNNIMPNDTLTIAATVSNPEIRSSIINFTLESKKLQNLIYVSAAENNPLFEIFKQIAAYDNEGKFKAFLEKVIDNVEKQRNVISIRE